MKLARLSVKSLASEIVNPVRDVRCLLDFSDEAAASYAVDTSGRKEEHVTGLYIVVMQYLCHSVVIYFRSIFLWSDVLCQTRHEVGFLISLNDIPHLCLAFRAVVPFSCELVVRMYLDGKVVTRINEFDQERELRSGLFIYFLAEQLAFVFRCKLSHSLAGEFSLSYDRFVTLYTWQLPALSDVVLICFNALERRDFFTAPYDGFEYCLEF